MEFFRQSNWDEEESAKKEANVSTVVPPSLNRCVAHFKENEDDDYYYYHDDDGNNNHLVSLLLLF